MNVIEKYFDYLATNPERIDNMTMWLICTGFIWFWMIKLRERAISGMEGSNKFWEGHEQIIYWAIMAMWPIVFYASFIKDVPAGVWYCLFGLIGTALFGRSILDYGLAFLGRPQLKKEDLPKEEVK